jgi:hypothetical protein
MRSSSLIEYRGHGCFECLTSFSGYLLSECAELLPLRDQAIQQRILSIIGYLSRNQVP